MQGLEPTVRQSALAFTEGVRTGWLTSDLVAWAQEHLVAPRRVALGVSGKLQSVQEHGFGLVVLHVPKDPRKLRTTTSSQVPQLVEAARQRVLQALRQAIEKRELDFVNAALFDGRVVRAKTPEGKQGWEVHLREDMMLSDQVLALFAADALEHPQHYEQELAVCDACGAVSLAAGKSRRGCSSHPFGTTQADRGRTPTPMRVAALRVRDSSP